MIVKAQSDKATASFEDGVLKLQIPKAEAVKPRQIRISPTIDGQSTTTPSDASSDTSSGGEKQQRDA